MRVYVVVPEVKKVSGIQFQLSLLFTTDISDQYE
ncbi:Uncharacterised protein [Cedecea neteri]|uniref:Uncharacterized protein n=1 Tax=Cedecea neteri TaxID=158822 RepID=A0A2X3JB11_9ENTR|nr:Uncharacterised protein [Cedecea neteri]